MLPMGVGISFFILRTKFLTQAFKRIAEHVGLIHEVRPNFGSTRIQILRSGRNGHYVGKKSL